jgi:hypothetical protein
MRQFSLPLDVNKFAVSQGFGVDTPATHQFYVELGLKSHNGTDFSCPIGTPLYAMFEGVAKVYVSQEWDNASNKFVDGALIIRIENRALGLNAFYCHLSEFKIKSGDFVNQGQEIGLSGNSGKYTTGAHLHLGIYLIDKNGNILNTDNGYKGAVNPLPYLVDLLDEGTLIKLPSNNLNFPEFDRAKVFEIFRNKRYWIEDENTFLWRYDYPVNEAKIKEVDVLTYNYYRYGGRILNQSKYVPST